MVDRASQSKNERTARDLPDRKPIEILKQSSDTVSFKTQ